MQIQYKKGKEPIIYDSVKNTFKHKIEFEDFLFYNLGFPKTQYDKRSGKSVIMRVLETQNMRSFVECALIVGMPINMVHELWNDNAISGKYKISYANLLKYYYFFWNLKPRVMNKLQFSRKDVAIYLLRDPYNSFYDDHRFLLDKTDVEMRFFTGFMTSNDRITLNKRLQGLLTQKMITSMKNKHGNLPQWAAMIWSSINEELREDEKDENGPRRHIEETRRILQTALEVHKDEEYIKKHKQEELDGMPEVKDEQIDIVAQRDK
ncbi:MAG: hypothetical protein PWQ09_1060 [Candidatus Cloacimonadota bacterium]|jgi:hypothetical protein|nr:hypothetical protein [Candidatus Cloacimonadota bacterium]